ncbi:histidine phosphatase family protein [Thermodesulfatator autotrophicus]|uniref:Alpha-ribazole phosphatase n=1 Tax=Thermodesulfatator autotrophicus TaxID=1795632 RepID=A0A177E970_9BACT|nr:histidine phosphatase family protein [Thermodesulfatator autotrophicus]OAG27960.1 hypothetical protein TH606_04285 [Thermodesulfatator autotrophicus]
MKPTRIFLVRHGEVKGPKGVLYSQNDVPLSEKGLKQSKELVEVFLQLPLAAVYTSDLTRARLPGEMLCQQKNIPHLIKKKLREINFGAWAGKSFSELLEIPEFRERLKDPAKIKPPQGETLEELLSRGLSVIKEATERFEGQNVVFFIHGGLIRVLILYALGSSLSNFFRLQIDYAGINLIDFYPDGPVVRLMNGKIGLNLKMFLNESFI